MRKSKHIANLILRCFGKRLDTDTVLIDAKKQGRIRKPKKEITDEELAKYIAKSPLFCKF